MPPRTIDRPLAPQRDVRVAVAEQMLPLLAAVVVGVWASYVAAQYLYLSFRGAASPSLLVVAHFTAAASAIGIGGLQFLPDLRRHSLPWHRWIGRTYVGASLFAGTSALFIAALRANTDAGSIGLVVTALLWVFTTAAGLRAIRRRLIVIHRRWMIRSYALALTAMTIRLIYGHAVPRLGVSDPGTAGAVATWAALISNLAVAEWAARRVLRRRQPTPASGLETVRS